jgi:DNA sulfur modification protein DndB
MEETTFIHTFPAVRGVQAGRPCYIAMCPMRLIPKIFVFDEDEVPAELRAQRVLNKSRIPEIAAYLVDHFSNYTLSSITASVNGKVGFTPLADTGAGQNMGSLSIPMEAQILINDGQHRRAAIESALKENPELGHDHVSVLFFIDDGLIRSQQMFADLNKHAVRPSDSISTLYDHRDQQSEMARFLVKKVTIFSRMTELEKSSISNRSSKLFTISSIKNASKALLRKGTKDSVSDEEMELAAEYWEEVGDNMLDWQQARRREIATSELREHYVHAHGVALQALGHAGADLLAAHPKAWRKSLKKLKNIDWARANPDWEGRAMVHGRISKARANVKLTTNYIKHAMNLPLNNIEQEAEEAFTG